MTRVGLSHTLTALNAEWAELQHSSRPPAWGFVPGATLGEVLASVRDDPDAGLGGLLGGQHAGDALAGRLVVQAMLPKLVLMAARDAEASLDEYLAAFWVRVATYPLARRPGRIAANLALDTLKSVKAARPRAVMALPTVPVSDPLADATTVLDAGVRLGVIDALTRRTLEVVYVGGRTSRDAAAVLGTSPDAVRWRCSKGVRALRAVAGQLVEQLAA